MNSPHPNVDTVNRMTPAIVNQDHDTLVKLFTDDFVFHFRGPHPAAGDHAGVGGLLGVIGSFFEATGGDIENKTTKLRELIARDKEKTDAKPPADLPKWE